jgi:phosphatidate cytidylyltransferase
LLSWRLILGTLFVVAFLAVCGFDVHAARPGTFLLPLAVLLAVLSAGELLAMFRKRGHSPRAWAVYVGTALTVLAAAAPAVFPQCAANHDVGNLGWLGLGLAAALSLALIAEMVRFDGSGIATTNVALSFLAIAYAGGLMGFLIELRLILYGAEAVGSESERHWAMHMFLVTIFTVKISDIGQYVVGRAIGKHKLAPRISPGKTWEGAVGGVLLGSVVGAALILLALRKSASGQNQATAETIFNPTIIATLLYVVSLCIAGIVGDLAESLLKRDAGVKDSSTWMPGFGGVLDLLDSLLGAAPVAYLFWAMHWIG